jgi:glycosyltransferase involved in cell wall biosynthesis
MKLLIYSHFFSPSVGGVEITVRSLAAGLSELNSRHGSRDFNVTLVTNTEAASTDDAGFPFPVVRKPGLLQLWRLIRGSDVVHVAGPALAPMLLSSLARKPTVIEHHMYQAVCPNGLLLQQPGRTVCIGHFQAGHYLKCVRCLNAEMSLPNAFATLFLMFPRYSLSRRAAKNLAVTEHVQQRLALPRSSVLYHGVEECAQTMPADNSRQVSFAYVGRFVPEKGLPILVRATVLLRSQGYNLDVRFIGDGPERQNLQSMISAHGLDSCMRITGYLTGAALADSLRDIRVVVIPSIWEETAGLAAMEQMMRGRLVIAADIGGISEVLGDAALKFPPGDSEALASAMRRVLQDPTLIDSLGSKARDRAKCLFNRRKMIEEHAAVYRNLLTENRAAEHGAA